MTQDSGTIIVGFGRTPFGRFGGKLAGLSAAELGSLAIDRVIERTGLALERIDAVYAGVGMIGAATLTPVRQAVMMSRLPLTTPSLAVDRACCSGMTAIGLAHKDIVSGASETVLCGGFEALSRTPRLLPREIAGRPGTVEIDDPLLLRAPVVDRQIAVYTGEESLRHGVDRALQDEWALASHARYFAAEAEGYFAAERFAVDAPAAKGAVETVASDESPRRDSSLERLARLPAIYGGATVTAGNAPGLNDGAAFLVAMNAGRAGAEGLKPLARIVGYAQVAGGPTSGTSTPALAIARLLDRHGIGPDALDLIEINEAYAATPLVSTLVLANGDAALAGRLRARTNVHGGAVAIGHPLGASGARIVMTLIAGLRRRGGGLGAAAICGGFGQGDAILVDVRE